MVKEEQSLEHLPYNKEEEKEEKEDEEEEEKKKGSVVRETTFIKWMKRKSYCCEGFQNVPARPSEG
jgi:hypothetical protein